jgi:hypothetical protein
MLKNYEPIPRFMRLNHKASTLEPALRASASAGESRIGTMGKPRESLYLGDQVPRRKRDRWLISGQTHMKNRSQPPRPETKLPRP